MKDVIEALQLALSMDLITEEEAGDYAHILFAQIATQMQDYDRTIN